MKYRKIKDLKKLPNNPRIIKDDDFKKLCESIKKNPDYFEARPLILSNRTGELIVIAGNQRIEAAITLKLKEVPTFLMENLSEEKEREIIIRDNISNGQWDYSLLANEWDSDELEAWGLDIPDFMEVELEAVEDDYEEPEQMQVDVVLGDLIEIGEHRLLCGDSTCSDSVAKLMNGEKADMVFTDPPYGVDYKGGHNKKKRQGIENDSLQGAELSSLFTDSINTACLFSESHAAFYIWYADRKATETFKGLSQTDIEIRAIICWYKVKSGLGSFMSQYIPNHEPCIYGFKKGCSIQWFGESDEKTIWELKKDIKNEFHPTQKPVALAEKAIKNSSKKNQIIYDCFLGGGTTMLASDQLQRVCYGMELDPKYCQVIIDRMMKLDSSLEVKINGKVYEGAVVPI